MRCLRSIVAFAVVTLLAVHAAPAPVPGQSTFTADRYVESVAGNLPIVLTAPHGGALKPDSIANRKEGVLGADLNSLELARALTGPLNQMVRAVRSFATDGVREPLPLAAAGAGEALGLGTDGAAKLGADRRGMVVRGAGPAGGTLAWGG